MEWFRDIPNYPMYNVSNKGRVVIEASWTFIEPFKNVFSNMMVRMVNRTFNVERVDFLVYKAFVGDIPEGCDIKHIDGKFFNCELENLQLIAIPEPLIKKTSPYIRPSGKSYPIRLVETDEKFVSIAEARRKLKISYYKIHRSTMTGKPTDHGMTFVRI